ncbi:MAG: hypothetical protein GX273_09465 [Bacteroidales bacterium]|nr:hypothetical protein [Bacteroidales bacterium]
MTEEEFYRINRDKIKENDISTWKYFPIGEFKRKIYDYHYLSLKNFLKTYYNEFEKQNLWINWMRNIILPVFKNEISNWKRYNVDINNEEYKLWFEEKHKLMVNYYNKNKSLILFEDDIILFLSYLETFEFFQDANLTLEKWIDSKNYNIVGMHKVGEDKYSLQDMAKEKYGNNLIRDKLMSLEWHKR